MKANCARKQLLTRQCSRHTVSCALTIMQLQEKPEILMAIKSYQMNNATIAY